MKKNFISIFLTILFIFTIFCPKKSNAKPSEPINVAVFEYLSSDGFITEVHKSLESIENSNTDKVKFTFYDGANSQNTQNEQVTTYLNNVDSDLILLNMVDPNTIGNIMPLIKNHNIPVIVYNREPISLNEIISYRRALYIGTEAKESGILQGKIFVDDWNMSKKTIDRNDDDIVQYIMFIGNPLNLEAIERTAYSTATIQSAGINVDTVANVYCSWDRSCARESMKAKLLQYGDKIEAVIANNDEMAIGAIEALQSFGYNKENSKKIMPVIGVDAIPEARELISKGLMTGTVVQNPEKLATALYSVGLNMVNGNPPLQDTEYTFDSSGVAIRIPYEGVITNYN